MYHSGRIRCWRAVSAAICGIALLVANRSALASPDDYWDSRFFQNGTDGVINGAVFSGGNLYVAGYFTSIFGVKATNIARWDGATWSALGSGINNGQVFALAVSGGDVYAGGNFNLAGGVSAICIAKWDGSTWSALGSGMPTDVRALTISGGDVYAGGYFTTAGGSPASYMAKWNGSTWSALGTGMNGVVRALTASGTDVYAGGDFTSAGGTSANYIAHWDGSTWSSVGTGVDSTVFALAASGGDLYAGGEFTHAGGVSANYVAHWNGSSWSALGSGTPTTVKALAASGSDLYATGDLNSGYSPYVAKWNGASWTNFDGGFGGFGGGDMAALAVSGSDVYLGGDFLGIGGTSAVDIAHWNGSAWSLVTAPPGAGIASAAYFYHSVRALARSASGDLYAGGIFEYAGDVSAHGVAKWDGTSWSPLGNLEGMTLSMSLVQHGFANALSFHGGDLIVGGNFLTAGGVTVNHIASWDGTNFSALGSGIDTSGYVSALAEFGGDLYAGGGFGSAGGVSVSNIARWNGSSWAAVGSGTNNVVTALAAVGPYLYAGGYFTTAGGTSASNIARWDGTSWSAVGTGIDSIVSALAVVGTDLYAGGGFTTAGGTSATNIARWDGSSWSALGSGTNGTVSGLGTVGTDLYAGGGFTNAGGVSANYVAKWNGVSWSALGSGLAGGAQAFATAGSDVYVGGTFPAAGGKPSMHIALWHNCGNGVVDPGEECDDGNTVSGDCCSATCQIETGNNPCPDDGNTCTTDQCDGSGGCAHVPNSLPCDDGLFCNGIDVCSGGSCSLHAGDPCPGPDGDANCSESCDEATDSCTAPDPDGSSCNDGLFCNGADTCSGGVCSIHAGDPCPGPNGNANCSESCDEASDSCTAPDPDGSPCNDGFFCNGADTCSGGACATHAGDPCASGPECAHVCNEVADNCFDPSGTACTSDSNPCTLDQCNGSGACAHPAGNAGAICRASAGQCDVAETCTGTSITCPADAFQPNGTPCNDGNACTSGDSCTNGSCAGGPPTVCALCDTCTPGGGCVAAPRPGCKLPTASGKALLTIKNKTPDTGDGIGFKWSPGAATTLAELGDPLTSDDYALCVYSGVGDTLIFRGTAPAGGMCGGLACWSPLGAHGFKYGDADLTPDGTMKLQLKSGLAGKAKASFKGKGVNLSNGLVGLPAPPLVLPLRAQLQAENGTCFEADFSSTPIKNAPGLFKAKGD